MNAQITDKIKSCPKCGATFSCTPADCWCAALPPVMPMIENADCYCPKCLSAVINEKLTTVQ